MQNSTIYSRFSHRGINGLTNPQRLANTFQSVKNVSISSATIKKYIEYLADAFLLEPCNRYDVKVVSISERH